MECNMTYPLGSHQQLLISLPVSRFQTLFIGLFCLLACSLSISSANAADEPNSSPRVNHQPDIKMRSAYPKGEHTLRKYPHKELQRGQEGWVLFSYIVDKDGHVKDPIVLDSVGSDQFAKEALKTLKRYEFYPAIQNGEAIETSNNKYKFIFSIKKKKGGASKKFVRRYKNARQLLVEQNYEQFLTDMASLKKGYTNNHYENSFYWLLMSHYYSALDQSENYLASLYKTIAYEGEYLPKKIYASTLSRLYYQQLRAGEVANALKTAKTVEAYKKQHPSLERVLEHRVSLLEQLSKLKALATPGTIIGNTAWSHKLYRNSIGLEVQKGQVDSIEFRCERKVRRFTIAKDVSPPTWNLPKSWGNCTAFVLGHADTQFQLVEYLLD